MTPLEAARVREHLGFGRDGTTLHILGVREDTEVIAVCGSTRWAVTDEPVGKDDLICGPCMRSVPRDAPPMFASVLLELDRYLRLQFETMPYAEYLKTSHWEQMRQLAFSHYGTTCVLCDSTPVDVHHRTYARRGHERLGDLIVLCMACHASYHRRAS